MKKIILLFIAGLTIISCGGNKKKELEELESVKPDKFAIIMDAIYEKNDSIAVFPKVGANFLYDKPVTYKVRGSELIQRITINMPDGMTLSSFAIVASTNKEQKHLTIKNISLKNKDVLVLDGDNYKHNDFFMPDMSFVWDPKLLRCDLVHTNQYPPGLVGSRKLEELLAQ